MPQTHLASNPFMLMINPEVVIAAMEKSERLSGLNRHICRPLDRLLPPASHGEPVEAAGEAAEEADEPLSD